MAHTFEPGEAHQAFMRQLNEAADRFAGALPPVHRVAIAAQFLGQLVALVDETQYGVGEIQASIARNIESGNAEARGERPRSVFMGSA
jgi:hypothetical protein